MTGEYFSAKGQGDLPEKELWGVTDVRGKASQAEAAANAKALR